MISLKISAISIKRQFIIDMKPLSCIPCIAFLIPMLLIACGPDKRDSAELAQDKNVENFATRDSEKDADFVVATVEGSYAEIKLAQLAISKSSDTYVKDIARTLENDYSKVLNDLKNLSYKKGIAIPVEESQSIKKDIQSLQKEDENEFNKDWLQKITDQHEATIRHFESTAEQTQDADLKSWISTTLPDLRAHLDSVTAHHAGL